MKKAKTHSFKHFKQHAEIFLATVGLILLGNISFEYFMGSKSLETISASEQNTSAKEVCNSDWLKFKSNVYGYSICFPKSWYLVNYDENDQSIKNGAHTFFSYNYKQAVLFTKKGFIDWPMFVGQEPQIKFDLNVTELIDEVSESELNKLILTSPTNEEQIKNTSTWVFKTINNKNLITLSISTFNHENYQSLTESQNWKYLEQIIKSLEI